jgi:hypothetical protein
MNKNKILSIEYLLLLFPISLVFPNIFFNLDNQILNKIRLDHFITIFVFFFLVYKFLQKLWVPKFEIFIFAGLVFLHVFFAIIFTDFYSSDMRLIPFLGYLEGYISFIVFLLFIDYLHKNFSKKIKSILSKLIKLYIAVSFIMLGIILLIALNPESAFIAELFSTNTKILLNTYNVGRYIGPIGQPIESGFYAGFGMIICIFAYSFSLIKNKYFLFFGFLALNIIGLASGSKVYLLSIILVIVLLFLLFLRLKIFFYLKFCIAIIVFQLILIFLATYGSITKSNNEYLNFEQKIYIMKYYELNSYKSFNESLKIISGNRLDTSKLKNIYDIKDLIKKDDNDNLMNKKISRLKKLKEILTSTDSTIGPIKIKELNKEIEALENLILKEKTLIELNNKKKVPRYLEYQGPLDSQHKMIAAHGTKYSLIVIFSFYIYMIYVGIKIYKKNFKVGIYLLFLNLFVILTSLGFPIFFANKINIYSVILVYFTIFVFNKNLKNFNINSNV